MRVRSVSGLTQIEDDARQEQRLLAELAHNTLRDPALYSNTKFRSTTAILAIHFLRTAPAGARRWNIDLIDRNFRARADEAQLRPIALGE